MRLHLIHSVRNAKSGVKDKHLSAYCMHARPLSTAVRCRRSHIRRGSLVPCQKQLREAPGPLGAREDWWATLHSPGPLGSLHTALRGQPFHTDVAAQTRLSWQNPFSLFALKRISKNCWRNSDFPVELLRNKRKALLQLLMQM